MTPEEKARQKIDQWFSDAGWKVVNRDNYEPNCTAVAIREVGGNAPLQILRGSRLAVARGGYDGRDRAAGGVRKP